MPAHGDVVSTPEKSKRTASMVGIPTASPAAPVAA
jgi:hypothetical protein